MSSPPLTEAALPYRGMGSGIPRALGEWPQIELISEVSGNQFTALVRRPKSQWEEATNQVTEQVEAPVTGQVTALLGVMGQGTWSRKELMEKLNLKGRDNFEKLYRTYALMRASNSVSWRVDLWSNSPSDEKTDPPADSQMHLADVHGIFDE